MAWKTVFRSFLFLSAIPVVMFFLILFAIPVRDQFRHADYQARHSLIAGIAPLETPIENLRFLTPPGKPFTNDCERVCQSILLGGDVDTITLDVHRGAGDAIEYRLIQQPGCTNSVGVISTRYVEPIDFAPPDTCIQATPDTGRSDYTSLLVSKTTSAESRDLLGGMPRVLTQDILVESHSGDSALVLYHEIRVSTWPLSTPLLPGFLQSLWCTSRVLFPCIQKDKWMHTQTGKEPLTTQEIVSQRLGLSLHPPAP